MYGILAFSCLDIESKKIKNFIIIRYLLTVYETKNEQEIGNYTKKVVFSLKYFATSLVVRYLKLKVTQV